LTKLQILGIINVQGDAINVLGKYCPHLIDVGFLDCLEVDELALGNVLAQLTRHQIWNEMWFHMFWHKLFNLVGLDLKLM